MPAHKQRRVITLFLALLPSLAGAAGLGELRVVSVLGERFRAEIPLVDPAPATRADCFRLTTSASDAIAEAPWLADAQIALAQNPPRLLIRSRRAVLDPMLQIAIDAGCGAVLTRHYVALLSPAKDYPAGLPVVGALPEAPIEPPTLALASPGSAPRAAASRSARIARPGETALAMAQRLYPRDRAAQQRFVHRMVALNPDWLSSTAGDEVLPEGVSLRIPQPPAGGPASDRRRSPGKPAALAAALTNKATSGDRLVLSPDESPQAPPTAAEIAERIGDVEAQIRGMRAYLSELRADHPRPSPAIQTVLSEMETRLLSVELNVARINLVHLASVAPAATASPARDKVSAVAPTPGASFAETAKPANSAAAPAAGLLAAPVRAESRASRAFDIGMVLLGIAGLGVGLSVVFYRRAKGRRIEEFLAAPARSIVDPLDEEVRELPRSPTMRPAAQPPAASVEVTEMVQSGLSDDPEESEKPVEIADIMLAYGQTSGAIDVLKSFIEAHPAQSLRTVMRLLELYKQLDRRLDFEELAGQLAGRLKVPPMRWDEMRSARAASGEVERLQISA